MNNGNGYSEQGQLLVKQIMTKGGGQQGRYWNFTVTTYTQSANIIINNNCFAFMFTNLGDTIARVSGMVIFPSATPGASLGDSRSLSGHLLDMFKGNLTLAIQAPVGVSPLVEIVQLYYIETY